MSRARPCERRRPGARGARPSGARRAATSRSRSASTDLRPHRERRDEVAVHDVDVDHAARRRRRPRATCSRSRPKSAARIDGAMRGASYLDRASSRRSGCSSASRCWTCARSSSARRSPGRPSAARSGAGSTRSGSGPGRFGRAQPRLAAGRARRARASASIAGNIEAVGAVPVRQRCARMASSRPAAPRRRDACRPSRRARPPGRRRARAPRQQRVLLAAPAPRSASRRRRASAGRGARAASRARCTAGRAARGRSRRRRSKRLGVADDDAHARRAHPLRRSPAARGRGPRGARPRRSRPASPISAARCVVLPPGAAHRSSTRSPGCGSSAARDELRRARLRRERAGGVARVRRARRTAPSTTIASPLAARPGCPRGRRRHQRVDAQRQLGRLVVGGSSARVSSGPSHVHHSRRATRGASGGSPRRRRSSSAGSSTPSRWHRAQHRVDEPVAGARLGQLDRLGDRRVRRRRGRGTAAGRARAAARRGRRRVELAPVVRCGDDVVERSRALDRAERELLGERAVARRRGRAPRRAARGRPTRPRQHPAHDRVRGAPGGADLGGGRRHPPRYPAPTSASTRARAAGAVDELQRRDDEHGARRRQQREVRELREAVLARAEEVAVDRERRIEAAAPPASVPTVSTPMPTIGVSWASQRAHSASTPGVRGIPSPRVEERVLVVGARVPPGAQQQPAALGQRPVLGLERAHVVDRQQVVRVRGGLGRLVDHHRRADEPRRRRRSRRPRRPCR